MEPPHCTQCNFNEIFILKRWKMQNKDCVAMTLLWESVYCITCDSDYFLMNSACSEHAASQMRSHPVLNPSHINYDNNYELYIIFFAFIFSTDYFFMKSVLFYIVFKKIVRNNTSSKLVFVNLGAFQTGSDPILL